VKFGLLYEMQLPRPLDGDQWRTRQLEGVRLPVNSSALVGRPRRAVWSWAVRGRGPAIMA
jgi:hypothetical protein